MSSKQRAKTWPYPRHQQFRKEVEQAATSWFAKNGLAVQKRRSYILADRNQWPDNIILPEVVAHIQGVQAKRATQKQNFALHKYVHHGLSSQALLFNLMGSLAVTNALPLLASLLPGDVPTRAEFEYEDRTVFNEDVGQPTSIDLVLYNDQQQPRYFVESKFVETEFGGCSVFAKGDCDGRNPAHNFDLCYLHHIGRKYWVKLKEEGLLEGTLSQEKLCIFSQHYQFFRLLLFALAHDGYFVLLYDERSPTFLYNGSQDQRGLMPLLQSFIPQHLHTKIVTISLQKIVRQVQKSGQHGWLTEFIEKYGMANCL